MNKIIINRRDKRSIPYRIELRAFCILKNLYQRFFINKPNKTHIFVAGMQRSGTNMLMDILEWSTLTDVYHETDPRAFTNYEMKDIDTIRILGENSNAPFIVIKSLCELDQILFFLSVFESCKIIWLVRNYSSATDSAIKSFSNFVPQLERLAENKLSDGWRGRGMSDATQKIIKQVICSGDLTEADAAAMMWYYRNILFLEQNLQNNPKVLLLFYEDLVSNPRHILKTVCDFTGIKIHPYLAIRHIHKNSLKKPPIPLREDVESLCANLYSKLKNIDENHGSYLHP